MWQIYFETDAMNRKVNKESEIDTWWMNYDLIVQIRFTYVGPVTMFCNTTKRTNEIWDHLVRDHGLYLSKCKKIVINKLLSLIYYYLKVFLSKSNVFGSGYRKPFFDYLN